MCKKQVEILTRKISESPSRLKKKPARKKLASQKRASSKLKSGKRSRTILQLPEAPKLTVELVPQTCWFSNVRDHLSKAEWDSLRRPAYRKANYVCEICGGRGSEWPVECHEIWHYDDKKHIQKLVGLLALCPNCHEVKHIGLTGLRGKGESAREHLAKVNNWTKEQTDIYLESVWSIWRKRSRHQWKLDFTWLEQLGIHVEPKR